MNPAFIVYQSNSSNETKALEDNMEQFSQDYDLKLNGRVIVSSALIEGVVNITPEKGASVEELCRVTEKSSGIILKSTPEYALFKIKDTQYMVRYKPTR